MRFSKIAKRPRPSYQEHAQELSSTLPPLLANADQLAQTIMMAGEHGRRRSGLGDTFWQYRVALPGDSARMIDWRRSARADQTFIREYEWQAAQSVALWVDHSASMRFSSDHAYPQKAERAALLALTLGLLLLRGGERIGLWGHPPRAGKAQERHLATALATVLRTNEREEDKKDINPVPEYGAPSAERFVSHSHALLFSDFLGDEAAFMKVLTGATAHSVRGTAIQVLDRTEENFPYQGRMIIDSPRQKFSHQTLEARALQKDYQGRLTQKRNKLATMAQAAGWRFVVHHTNQPALPMLKDLYHSLQTRGAH